MLLSSQSTRAVVDEFVKEHGVQEAARQLTAAGFRSPRGNDVTHAQIHRIMHGSGLRLHDCPFLPEGITPPSTVEESVEEALPSTVEGHWSEEELSGQIPSAFSAFSGGSYLRLCHTP